MILITKQCTKCKAILLKSTIQFYKDKTKKDKLRTTCKACKAKQDAIYRTLHKEHIKQIGKTYYNKNKIKIDTQNKQWRIKNKEYKALKDKEYRDNNIEKIKKQRSKYYQQNKLKIKQYWDKNKDRFRKQKTQYREKNKKHRAKIFKQWSKKNKLYNIKRTKDFKTSPATFNILNKLNKYKIIKRDIVNTTLGQIKCKYCGRFTSPSHQEVESRFAAIKGTLAGENNIYCSEECKHACPTYRQRLYPKGFKKATSREVDPYIRQFCFEYDNYTCQKCDKNKNIQLHCHHIKGAVKEPLLANDIDNVITLCKECHQKMHKQDGCTYTDYKRSKCIQRNKHLTRNKHI